MVKVHRSGNNKLSSSPSWRSSSHFSVVKLLACASFGTGATYLGYVWFNILRLTVRTNTSRDAAVRHRLSPHNPTGAAVAVVEGDTNGGGGAARAADGTTKPTTVAWAVSVTGCGSDPITEGAAVLEHGIRTRASLHGSKSRYDYAMYAIYHPDAAECAAPLEKLGYTLLKREPFVQIPDIEGEYLRSKIGSNGCCGEKELIKFEAYTLTQYPIVVHLDLDTLVLKPLDELFDMMMSTGSSIQRPTSGAIMWPDKPLPDRIDAFYTYDYNMVRPKVRYKPIQGGFLVLRPSRQAYDEFKEIVRVGDFRDNGGWGGVVGPFYGSMTYQGLLPYYYDYLHPGTGVELNRCLYNQMCDNPRDKATVDDVVHGNCRTGQDDCEDCRSRPLEDVVTTHYTLCQKPWHCLPQSADKIQQRLCRKLHHEWFKIRSDLERSWGRTGHGPALWEQAHFFGYCQSKGRSGYLKIEEPYGKPAAAAAAADKM